jgi:hypothetical protein
MSDCVLRIDKLQNGFTVEVCDPAIMAENDKPKNLSYKSPWKEYAFSTSEEAVAFVAKALGKLKPAPDDDAVFASSFNAAASEK